MTVQTADDVREYCRAWSQRAAAQHRAERFNGGTARLHQGSPLASICDDIETADHDHLTAIVAGLAVCLSRQEGVFEGYGRDYRVVWAWCAELLVGDGSGSGIGRGEAPAVLSEPTLRQLFTITCHAVLARSVPGEILGVDRHARELVEVQATVVAYLAFPLIEQALRAACHRHFDRRGHIRLAFDTPGQPSGRHLYAVGGTCSSIGDLLWLYRQQYASIQMRANLDAIDSHLADAVAGGVGGFRILQTWRNETMHGGAPLPVIGAVVLSLAILVALADREEGFDGAIARLRASAARGGGAAQFYPAPL